MGGGTTKEIRVDHLQLRVTHSTPSGAQFVSLISVDLDPVDTKSPGANNSTDCNAWSNPGNAVSSNDKYAAAGPTVGAYSTMYQTFGFSIPSGNQIDKVEVLLEWFAFSSQPVTDPNTGDTCEVAIGTPGSPDTCGQIVDYTPTVSAFFANRTTEGIATVDVTSQRSWLPADFDNANLRTLLVGFRGIL